MNEEQTKLSKITPALQVAGWSERVDAESRILMEQHAYQIAPGRIAKTRTAYPKKVDYLLIHRGQKLAIVEAKSDENEVGEGVAQAKEYADLLKIRYTYAANGDEIYFMDMQTGEESLVQKFPTPEELWQLTFPCDNIWRDRFNNEPLWSSRDKSPRYYQEIAVNRCLQAVAENKKRILLTLATGTGKTFIAFQIAWKLFKTRWNLRSAQNHDERRIPRILFLTDRNILANQAFNDFEGFSDDALCRLTPNRISNLGKTVPKGASIYFTIFQTFMSGETPYYKQYDPDFFDFIIIDECHRGGANDESQWREILHYFSPAYQLGMTATPKRTINVDTYNYFGNPVYEYSLKQGIEDGFLTPYRVKTGTTTIDNYTYTDDDTIISGGEYLDREKEYTEKDFYRGKIEIKERDEFRVRELLSQIGAREKTIVFCATQNHAAQVRDMINRNAKEKHPFYCVRITADDGDKGEEQLRLFQDNEKRIPTVLTTSQKLSTGVNARNIRNIVLLRPIKSIIEFKQIIGRGTRLFDNKYFFTIYDFVGAGEHFYDPEWDGQPICPICGEYECDCDKSSVSGVCEKCGVRPCACEKSAPKVCKWCECSPCVCEGGQEKKTVKIQLSPQRIMELSIRWNERFMFDGDLLTIEQFIAKLYGKLKDFCGTADELRAKWANPESRQEFLRLLASSGFERENLERLQTLIDAEKCDLLDVLEYVAYNSPMLQREIRVQRTHSEIMRAIGDTARQQFIDFVLQQYILGGMDVLSADKIGALLELKYGTIQDGTKALGDSNAIRTAFYNCQQHLYSA